MSKINRSTNIYVVLTTNACCQPAQPNSYHSLINLLQVCRLPMHEAGLKSQVHITFVPEKRGLRATADIYSICTNIGSLHTVSLIEYRKSPSVVGCYSTYTIHTYVHALCVLQLQLNVVHPHRDSNVWCTGTLIRSTILHQAQNDALLSHQD